MRAIVFTVLFLVLPHCVQLTALAAEETQEKVKNKDPKPVLGVKLSLEGTTPGDLKDSDASLSFVEFAAAMEWKFLIAGMDHRQYDWENGTGALGGTGSAPWTGLTRLGIGLQYMHQFNDTWGVWPRCLLLSGFEDNITTASLTFNPQVAGLFSPTKRMKIYGGVGVMVNAIDLKVYPIFGMAWNIESKDGISGALGFPFTMLRLGLMDGLGIRVDFMWEPRYYQLSHDNDVAPEGHLKSEEMIAGLQIDYEILKGLTLSLAGRFYFGRTLDLFSSEEEEIKSQDVGQAYGVMFSMIWQV